MKIARATLETLKDLNWEKANQLYDKMIATYYEPKEVVDWNIMYIFPDGRMVGGKTKVSERGRKKRTVFHRSIYRLDLFDVDPDYMPEPLSEDKENSAWKTYMAKLKSIEQTAATDNSPENFSRVTDHPASNEVLATYYNLIVVVPLDEDSGILIPRNVEPTPPQLERIDQLMAKGYKMLNKNWRLTSGKNDW